MTDERPAITVAAPLGGWPRPWPSVAELADALPGGMGAVTSLGCDPLQSSSEIACWYSLVERAPLRQNISSGRGKALSKAAHCVISSGDW